MSEQPSLRRRAAYRPGSRGGPGGPSPRGPTLHEQDSCERGTKWVENHVENCQKMARQDRWQRRHMATISTKLRRNTAERFRCCCDRLNVKPYTIMRNLILKWTAEQEERAFPKYYMRRM